MGPSDLVACIQCGQLISRMSETCVKCGSDRPFARCQLCREPIRASEAFRPREPSHLGSLLGAGGGFDFHYQCVADMLPMPADITCRSCGASLKSQLGISDPVILRFLFGNTPRCQQCGDPCPHGEQGAPNCGWCGLRIFRHDKTGWARPGEWERGEMHAVCCRLAARAMRESRVRASGIGCLSVVLGAALGATLLLA